MSALTKRTTLTGNEEFQVSATEKVTAQQIADLASTGIQVVTVTNFQTNVWNNDAGTNVFSSVPVGGMVVFKSAANATSGPGEALMGYAIKISSIIASYVGMTTTNGANVTPTLYTHKSSSLYTTKWQKLPDEDNGDIQVVEITDFAIPSVNITKDGQSFFFYANDASNIPNTNHGATSFVGVAIASPIYITGDQRLLYYMMVDTAKAMFYTGYANLEDDSVTWSETPITRLSQAVQVTAFTEGALSALIYNYKTGDFIPFYTGNVTTSADNQFPESGVFNGFISMGSNEGDYFQIFAFKSGSTKAYLGACIGSTTQWTELGGNSGGRLKDVKRLTTSFWNLISANDSDIQAFVVDYNSPEVPAQYQGEGFGFARHYMDDVGMATVTIKLSTGWVKTFNVTFYEDGSDPKWEELGGSPSGGGLELVNTTYPILVGDGSEVVLPGVTSSDRLMINLQVIKTGSAVELWPTGSFCLHCPVPTGSGSYKLLDIYQFEKGVEADINISYVTKTDNSVTVQFNDYNNIDADFAASIHAIYKLPK